jgi:hypothetical protein
MQLAPVSVKCVLLEEIAQDTNPPWMRAPDDRVALWPRWQSQE